MVSEWVKEEMGSLDIGDKRLNKRLMHIISETSKQPEKSINRQFHTRKEMQACYRFQSNNLVDEKKIIAPHKKMTLNRAKEFPVILCPSDTTSLNYTTRKGLKDSGYISNNNSQGFFMHATIAVTPERLHLGMVDQKFWSREKEKKTKLVHRDLIPIEEKESYRWLEAYRITCKFAKSCKDTQIVHISDREGDIFEIFAEHESKKKEGCAADFLMRCNHNRTVYLNKKTSTLFKEIKNTKSLGEISFELELDELTRVIVQNIYALTATIKSADGKKTLSINSFCLEEIDPPEGFEPICWYLITSLPIDSIEEIEKAVKYYLCRWEIELLFKSFKSSLKIHFMKGESENVVQAMIYAKLISILIALPVISYAASICEDGEELSIDKTIKWLHSNNRFSTHVVKGTVDSLIRFMLSDFHSLCKDKRIGRLSTFKQTEAIINEELEEDAA